MPEYCIGPPHKIAQRRHFPRNRFFNQPFDEAKSLIIQAKTEMEDLIIVSLVSVFERTIFNHSKSPLHSKSVRQKAGGLDEAIKYFRQQISPRVYQDAERLCKYRDW